MRYSIQGDTLPVVICELDAGEKIITEGGGMAWMSPNMKMETTGGGIGKMFGRALSGDTLFQNIYTAERTNGMISIASSFPGSIKAFDITPGNEIILQKSAFLASEAGVELSMHFRKKLGSGLFGGEGFILQKLSGNGIAFAEFDGHVIRITAWSADCNRHRTPCCYDSYMPDGYSDRSRNEEHILWWRRLV